ncbi:MAG: AAA family ATPase [Bacteriovoracaceae bacterium]|nr:AAA family ATPase [Bacteriovoracaceae bacterium]
MPTLNLKSLNIQNFATFENQEVTFDSKFNAIVGETGSGKSLILDALQLIFGSRADRKIVRRETQFASIEATFTAAGSEIESFFDQLGFPFEGGEIVVKRLIYATGKSKSYLNYQSCSLGTLVHFSRRFVDLVGQFENQKLLSEDYQMVLLDRYSTNGDRLSHYYSLYEEISKKRIQIEELKQAQLKREQREDYLRFQLSEIEILGPSIEDEKANQAKKDLILNSEQRKEIFSSALNSISEGDHGSALGLVGKAINALERNLSLVTPELLEKLHNAGQALEEVSFDLSKELDNEFEEQDLENIIDRLDTYQKLKRKFGGSTEQLLSAYTQLKKELSQLIQADSFIAELEAELKDLIVMAWEAANQLSSVRHTHSSELSREITNSVRELKMDGASVCISIEKTDKLGPKGADKISFMAETNHGEGFFKVKDTASGGELSRILLSVRRILSSTDSISVFLFDEIDAGIGGETAVCTGSALKSVSACSQVIAITHLPQIAYFADKLINVTKHLVTLDNKKRTLSRIDEIDEITKKTEFIKGMTPIEV